uniref:Calponin-homology (CH) domain-containing protein n=1 Tax=Megaselia scalaris TaxID=36166 RepID=T1GK08_MEGSC
RNKDQEAEVLNWIFEVLGEKVPSGQYEDILKDGVILCKLINKMAPGSVKKIQERGTNFQLMENVQRFQAAIKKYGTQKHPEYTGPSLGPKMADKNERTFTEEQL